MATHRRHFPSGAAPRTKAEREHRDLYQSTSQDGDRMTADDGNQRREDLPKKPGEPDGSVAVWKGPRR
jgi:hypothetical protein